MDRDRPGDSSPTKAEMIDRIDRAWRELQATIGAAAEDELTRPGEGGWSAKDHLAHLAAWERSLVALLGGDDRAAAALGADPGAAREAPIEAINDAIYRRFKEIPVAAVLADLRLGHEHLLATIDPLSDDDLRRSYASYQPGDPRAPDEPVVAWVAGNTYEHYDEHTATIRALLDPPAVR